MSYVAWKENWDETRRHFVDWWNHEGLVVGLWNGVARKVPREAVRDPGEPQSSEEWNTRPHFRAEVCHFRLAYQDFPLDVLPLPEVSIGPGSLALLLGSEPKFSEDTVWFEPCIDPNNPEGHPVLRLDPANRWLRMHEEQLRACVELGRGKYLVGCPDLIENIDILAAMRGPQYLLTDMIERPEWVEQKVWEINEAWFNAYQRLYEIIKLPDGSSCFEAFRIWGPGKVAKVQCDASAMFSRDMFARFVAPALAAQCEWLDHSMFHLDGHQCLQHLDVLLEIEALDAIEWTPDPLVPGGGNPCWYPLYRRILAAGKSVQAIEVRLEELAPLLDAVGPKGMYVVLQGITAENIEQAVRIIERYRS